MSFEKRKMAATRERNGRKREKRWDTPAPSTGAATEAAHEAARKLNAMLAAKGKLTINSTPPLLPTKAKPTMGSNSGSASTSSLFTEEVEINDSARRLLLCQSNVQYEINKYSGAAISTKGQYIAPSEKGNNMTSQKPLCLFIQANSKDKVNLAVQRIQGIMNGDDPFTPPILPQQIASSGQSSTLPSGTYYIQEKVFVGLDNTEAEFRLKEKIVGPAESYFHHITKETGAKVHLRGRGSGFIEPTSGREAFEALYVYISHTNYPGLGAAKKLVENLIQTVHTAYQQFQMQQTSNSYYPNYGGYPAQNTAQLPQQPPNVHNMPPVSGYGHLPHPAGPVPSNYPSYPYPYPNQPHPHYNQPAPNYINSPNPQMPPPRMHPNPAFRQEGPKPLMDQRPTYREPPMSYPTPTPYATEDRPQSPTSHSHHDAYGKSDNEVKSRQTEEKPVELSRPVKRRFTEAPAKKTPPLLPAPESFTIEKRSVSSLDQQSTQSHTPGEDVVKRNGNMAPPVLPAPKVKRGDGNVTKESGSSSDSFKIPLMPVSDVVSGAKKTLFIPPVAKQAGKKRKLDQPSSKNSNTEKKSTGIALLGSYDDSSDED